MVFQDIDTEEMPFDAFRSRTAINKRNRQRAIDRSKQETALQVEDTAQAKLGAEARKANRSR